MKLSLMAFMAMLALTSADIYDNCGANGENCFAIPKFESDVKTCIAQRDCTVVTSFNRMNEGMIKFEIEAKFNGVDDGSHWVPERLLQDIENSGLGKTKILLKTN